MTLYNLPIAMRRCVLILFIISNVLFHSCILRPRIETTYSCNNITIKRLDYEGSNTSFTYMIGEDTVGSVTYEHTGIGGWFDANIVFGLNNDVYFKGDCPLNIIINDSSLFFIVNKESELPNIGKENWCYVCPGIDVPVVVRRNAEYNSKVIIDCKGGHYCNFANTWQESFSGIAGERILLLDTVIHKTEGGIKKVELIQR